MYSNLFPSVYVWANKDAVNGVTFKYDNKSTFSNNQLIYGNEGKISR